MVCHSFMDADRRQTPGLETKDCATQSNDNSQSSSICAGSPSASFHRAKQRGSDDTCPYSRSHCRRGAKNRTECLIRRVPKSRHKPCAYIPLARAQSHGLSDLQGRLGKCSLYSEQMCALLRALSLLKEGIPTVSGTPFKAFSKTRAPATPEELWATANIYIFDLPTPEFCMKALRTLLVLPANFASKIYEAYRVWFIPDHIQIGDRF